MARGRHLYRNYVWETPRRDSESLWGQARFITTATGSSSRGGKYSLNVHLALLSSHENHDKVSWKQMAAFAADVRVPQRINRARNITLRLYCSHVLLSHAHLTNRYTSVLINTAVYTTDSQPGYPQGRSAVTRRYVERLKLNWSKRIMIWLNKMHPRVECWFPMMRTQSAAQEDDIIPSSGLKLCLWSHTSPPSLCLSGSHFT